MTLSHACTMDRRDACIVVMLAKGPRAQYRAYRGWWYFAITDDFIGHFRRLSCRLYAAFSPGLSLASVYNYSCSLPAGLSRELSSRGSHVVLLC